MPRPRLISSLLHLFSRHGSAIAMEMDEKRNDDLEQRFIKKSNSAFREAYKKSISHGYVMISEKGNLYKVAPDGSRTYVKNVEPPTKVKPGLKVKIR